MPKCDRTLQMEVNVQNYFEEKYNCEMVHEAFLPNYIDIKKRGTVDFLGFFYDREDELCDVIAIELKQSETDLHSGCGLNFVGSSNYLAVSPDIVGPAIVYLREMRLYEVGVLQVRYSSVDEIIRPKWNYNNKFIESHDIILRFGPPHILNRDINPDGRDKTIFISKKYISN